MKHVKKCAALSLLIAAGMLSCSSDDSKPPMLGDTVVSPPAHPIVDAGRPRDATLPPAFDSGVDASIIDASEEPDVNDGSVVDASPDVLDSSVVDASDSGIDDAGVDASDAGVPEDNGIIYHGGPVMLGAINVYYIWYGDWSKNLAAKPILTDLAANIGKSPYYKINLDYYSIGTNQSTMSVKANLFNELHHLGTRSGHSNYDQNEVSKRAAVNFSGEKDYVSNVINYVGSYDDNYSLGKALTQDDIFTIVKSTIDKGIFPNDYNGVYFVLTSADVVQSYNGYNFCQAFCGWHGFNPVNSVNIKYSFVGDPAQCPTNCAEFTIDPASDSGLDYLTPNNNFTADGMASILSHELEEAISDPELDAWFDQNGQENADKCAWRFGNIYDAPNGARANMKVGTRDYLIQHNWVNADGGFCAVQK